MALEKVSIEETTVSVVRTIVANSRPINKETLLSELTERKGALDAGSEEIYIVFHEDNVGIEGKPGEPRVRRQRLRDDQTIRFEIRGTQTVRDEPIKVVAPTAEAAADDAKKHAERTERPHLANVTPHRQHDRR